MTKTEETSPIFTTLMQMGSLLITTTVQEAVNTVEEIKDKLHSTLQEDVVPMELKYILISNLGNNLVIYPDTGDIMQEAIKEFGSCIVLQILIAISTSYPKYTISTMNAQELLHTRVPLHILIDNNFDISEDVSTEAVKKLVDFFILKGYSGITG